MSSVYRLLIPISLFLFAGQNFLSGQSIFNPVQQEAPSNTDSVEVFKAIPLTSINNESRTAFALFRRLNELQISRASKLELTIAVDTAIQKANTFFSNSDGQNFERINYRELDELQNAFYLLRDDVSDIQERINHSLETVQNGVTELSLNKQLWDMTLRESNPRITPEAILKRINTVLSRNDSINNMLERDVDFLLTQSDKITELRIKIDVYDNVLREANKISGTKVFRRDMPPVWELFTEKYTLGIASQWKVFKSHFLDDTRFLFNQSGEHLIIGLILFIILLIFTFLLKKTVKYTQEEARGSMEVYVKEILNKPIFVSLLIGLYLLFLIISDFTQVYSSILSIIAAFAIMHVAHDILPVQHRKFVLGIATSFILFYIYVFLYDQHLLSRLFLILSQLFAGNTLLAYLRKRSGGADGKRLSFNNLLSYLSGFYLFLLILSFIASILGAISFSDLIGGAAIKSGFMIITVYVGFHITAAYVFLLLHSSFMKKSNIIRNEAALIFSKIYRLLRVLFIVVWIFIAFDQFKIKVIFVEWGNSFLTNEISIGEAHISLINIIIFFLVIWLSLFLSKLLRHILHEEVFTRVQVERGMPGTITMLFRVAIVTIGFMVAAKAAGMALTNLTIILGAFSVGIGFGLQNIFNNLVSGLILAFERPIKEGDMVELNSLLGVVKKIGIRSSIVRLTSGAEVIVPNGELISKELINWTLSDHNLRADIKIGVAYGTDPQVVIDLLIQVAKENKRVNIDPVPQAFFIDFGESSLDFRLLAWVDMDIRRELESEMRLEIVNKLKEAGIEIPFPQTDLHVKSVTEEASMKLKGK